MYCLIKKYSQTLVKSWQGRIYLGGGVTIIIGIGNNMMKFCSVGDRLDLTPNTPHVSVNLQAKNRAAVSRCKIRETSRVWGILAKAI